MQLQPTGIAIIDLQIVVHVLPISQARGSAPVQLCMIHQMYRSA